MRFTHCGVTYKIWFKYNGKAEQRRETLCLIDVDGSETSFSVGASTCAPSDNFDKATGRKIALTRALQGEPKAFRRAAWTAYLNRGKPTLSEVGQAVLKSFEKAEIA